MYGSMALFEPDGAFYVPTDLSRGPWRDDALHGGPVAGLAVRAAERHVASAGTHLARASIELLRPVRFAPLRPTVEVIRAGRSIRLLRVELHDHDGLVTLAHLLAVADADLVLPPDLVGSAPRDQPNDGRADSFGPRDDTVRFHSHAVDVRVTEGALAVPGPATAWFRLRIPLVAGEQPTAAQRAAVIADLSGIGSVLPGDAFSYPNAELTIHLQREPVGEWIRLASTNEVGPHGVGLTFTELADSSGAAGRVVQTQIITARASTPA